MPRTSTPVTTTYNTGAAPTTTAIDPTNGHTIPASPNQSADDLLIVVNNTFAGTKTVTIKAGANPPALSAGQGDRVITCAASTNGIPVRVETARHVQADGSIWLDCAAAMTGSIVVYQVRSQ